MTRESAQAGITCPKCDGLSAPNQNFCGYCGAALNGSNRRRDYECAVGSAILALNSLESEVFYLLDILDVHCVVKERTKKGNGQSFTRRGLTMAQAQYRFWEKSAVMSGDAYLFLANSARARHSLFHVSASAPIIT